MDAEVGGTLDVRAPGCVVLVQDGFWYPVVWPAGTGIASTDPLRIGLPSGAEIGIGDQVNGGGGYLKPDRIDVDIPADCLPETREVAVFNASDDPLTD